MRPAQFAELQAFIAIAEARSFRRAAARLGLTSSTLSHALRSLEERMGLQLIARTTRTVEPTLAGAALLAELTPAVRAMDAAVEAVNAFRARLQGVVRLTVPRVAATMVVAPRLAAFAAAYPEVTLEMTVDDRFVDIVREGYDGGIRLGESLERDTTAVRLTGDLRGAAVASPAYFLRHAPPRTPQDLQAHRCINRRLVGSGALFRWEFAKGNKRLTVLPDGPMILNADDVMLTAALDGVGIAMLSEVDAEPHVAAGRLLRVLQDWCPPISGFFLYHPRSRQGSASLRALVEVLTAPVP